MKKLCHLIFLTCLLLNLALLYADEKNKFQPEDLTLSHIYGNPEFMHGGGISHIIPLADGKRLMTSARDDSVRVWDIKTGKELTRFADYSQKDGVWNFKLLPEEKEFIACYESMVLRWDMITGKVIAKYPHNNKKDIYRLAISDDGTKFAAVGGDKQIKVWEFNGKKPLKYIEGANSSVYTVEFANNDMELITGGADESVDFWNLANGKEIKKLKNRFGNIYTIKKSDNGRNILICSQKNNIQMSDAQTGKAIWEGGLPDDVKDADWSPDRKFITAVCDNNQLFCLDAATGKILYGVQLPKGSHWGVAYSKDGKKIFCGANHLLCVFEAETGKRIFPDPEIEQVLTGGIRDLAVNEELGRCYYISNNKGLGVMSLNSGKQINTWLPNKEINCIFLSPNGKKLYYFDDNAYGELFVIDSKTGKELNSKVISNRPLNGYSFSNKGDYLALTCNDKNIYILNLKKQKSIKQLSGHNGSVQDVSFSPNDDLVFSVGYDSSLRIWDVDRGKLVDTLNNGEKSFDNCIVSFSDNPQVMVSQNNTIICWDLPKDSINEEEKNKIITLIKKLGDENFEERENATRDLIKIGYPLMEIIKNVRTDDPEIKDRIKQVSEGISKIKKILATPVKTQIERLNDIAFHPKGNYWIISTDKGLTIGKIKEREFKVIRNITDNNNPEKIRFGKSGNIYTANKNGTISKYSFKD